MKHVFTVSIDEKIVAKIKDAARNNKSRFRNKSHLVEEAIERFLDEI